MNDAYFPSWPIALKSLCSLAVLPYSKTWGYKSGEEIKSFKELFNSLIHSIYSSSMNLWELSLDCHEFRLFIISSKLEYVLFTHLGAWLPNGASSIKVKNTKCFFHSPYFSFAISTYLSSWLLCWFVLILFSIIQCASLDVCSSVTMWMSILSLSNSVLIDLISYWLSKRLLSALDLSSWESAVQSELNIQAIIAEWTFSISARPMALKKFFINNFTIYIVTLYLITSFNCCKDTHYFW